MVTGKLRRVWRGLAVVAAVGCGRPATHAQSIVACDTARSSDRNAGVKGPAQIELDRRGCLFRANSRRAPSIDQLLGEPGRTVKTWDKGFRIPWMRLCGRLFAARPFAFFATDSTPISKCRADSEHLLASLIDEYVDRSTPQVEAGPAVDPSALKEEVLVRYLAVAPDKTRTDADRIIGTRLDEVFGTRMGICALFVQAAGGAADARAACEQTVMNRSAQIIAEAALLGSQ